MTLCFDCLLLFRANWRSNHCSRYPEKEKTGKDKILRIQFCEFSVWADHKHLLADIKFWLLKKIFNRKLEKYTNPHIAQIRLWRPIAITSRFGRRCVMKGVIRQVTMYINAGMQKEIPINSGWKPIVLRAILKLGAIYVTLTLAMKFEKKPKLNLLMRRSSDTFNSS